MDFQILQKDIDSIVDCVEGYIEKLLMVIKVKLEFQSDPESMAQKKAQLAKINGWKEKEKNAKKVQELLKKGGKENKVKVENVGLKKDDNLEKQLYEKNQKMNEMTVKIQLLEQKLKNCEELLGIKEEKIKILQKPGRDK